MEAKGSNILIAGVGGQGTLLASRVIGNVALRQGYDVKLSEVHGMSQRGGSVVTHVKFAPNGVHAPIIDRGQADVVIAFEALEAFRSLCYIKEGGTMLLNIQRINPMPVITGAADYPLDIAAKIAQNNIHVAAIDALAEAKIAGSERAVNMVMIGLLAAHMSFERQDWLEAIKESVKPKFLDANLLAFEAGYCRKEVSLHAH